jgi:hypothetical protein
LLQPITSIHMFFCNRNQKYIDKKAVKTIASYIEYLNFSVREPHVLSFKQSPSAVIETLKQSLIFQITMTSESIKRSYEDDDNSSKSSCPDSPIMLPMMMTDENGVQKFVFSERKANELMRNVSQAQARKKKELSQVTELKRCGDLVASSTDCKKGTHGLAPSGMSIPPTGCAYRFGGGIGGVASSKQPLKESNQEKYTRIKAEQDHKSYKKNKRAVKKLKREGKVSTLASFMYS